MIFFRKILIFFLLIGLFFLNYLVIFAQTGETGASLQVTGTSVVCNNNGVCESGENSTNCPLDCPVPPIPPPTPPAPYIPDREPPTIYNIIVKEVTLNSVKIEWEVSEAALCQLSWGKTSNYEEGVAIEKDFTPEKHSTSLIGLLPATLYYFEISCHDSSSNVSARNSQFSTLTPPDFTPPANVSDFSAEPGDKQIKLSWKNPSDADFEGVRIVRSTNFYPENPQGGILVYDGNGESFLDEGLENGVRYYYTAFTYDRAKNYSSGAIVSGVPHKPGVIPPPEEITTSTIPITPEIEKLDFKDFDFYQGGKKIIPTEGKLDIKSNMPLTASIAYEKVPEVLKTIMVTLENESGKIFSFLLRVNKEKTRYESVIASPDPGVYPLTMNILDYKNQRLKILKGELVIEGQSAPVVKPNFCQKYCRYIYILLALLILLLIAYLAKKYRDKKKNEKVE
jgi:hypothetical protein